MASKGAAASASMENSNTGGTSGNSSNGDSASQDSTFECNICLDTAKDAVISLCGHLFWLVSFSFTCPSFIRSVNVLFYPEGSEWGT